MNCVLTIKQQKLLLRKVAADLDDSDKFDFRNYAASVHYLIVDQTGDKVLAANYVSLLPMNIRAVMGVSKSIFGKLATSAGQIYEYEARFEDFKNVESFVNSFETEVTQIVNLEKTIQKASLTKPEQQKEAPESQQVSDPIESLSLSDIPMDSDRSNFLRPEMKVYADVKEQLIKNVQPDGSSKLEDGSSVRLTIMSTKDFQAGDFYPDTQRHISTNDPKVLEGMKTGVVMVVTDMKGEPVRVQDKLIYYILRKPKGDVLDENDKVLVNSLKKQGLSDLEADTSVKKKLNLIKRVRDYIGEDYSRKVPVDLKGGVINYASKVTKNKRTISNLSVLKGKPFSPYKGIKTKGQLENVYYFYVPDSNMTLAVNSPSIPQDLVTKLTQLLTDDLVRQAGSKSLPYSVSDKIRLFNQFVYADPDALDLYEGEDGNLVIEKMGVPQIYASKQDVVNDIQSFLTQRIPVKRLTEEQAKAEYKKGRYRVVNLKTADFNSIYEKVNPDGNVEYYQIGLLQLKVNDTAYKSNQYNDFEITGNVINVTEKSYYPFIADNFLLPIEIDDSGNIQTAGSVLNFEVSPQSMVDMTKNNKPIKNIKNELQDIFSGKSQVSQGTAIQAAYNYLRGEKTTSGETSKRNKSKEEESELLKKYADQNGLLVPDNRLDKYFAKGTEAQVYEDKDPGYVLKVNDIGSYSSWSAYLKNILAHNYFFPDTAYELIGFKEEGDKLNAVVKQPYVDTTETTKPDDIVDFLRQNGFIQDDPLSTDYHNNELGIKIADLHLGNVLTKKGILYFIDTAIYFNPKVYGVSEKMVDLIKENKPRRFYKEVPILETSSIGIPIINARGVRAGAQYNKIEKLIKFDREVLQQKFKEKAWTKPQLEGVKALPENQFKIYQEFENFVLEHEYLHSKFIRQEKESLSDYENRINDLALGLKLSDLDLVFDSKSKNLPLFDDSGNIDEKVYNINESPIDQKLSPKEKLLKLRKDNPNAFNKLIGQKGLEATLEQIDAAEKWYSAHSISTYFPFTTMFDVVNQKDSNSIATWITSGITLFKGADYSDLYHEAWHGFTQGFLSQDDKVSLYNEMRKKSGSFIDYNGNSIEFKDSTDLQIEEFLAEDFREYMLSDGKKVLKDSPKRNTIFRRILNFLKSIFGTASVKQAVIDERVNQTVFDLYNKLRVGDLTDYTFAVENRNFDTLNKALQAINPEEDQKSLSFENSLLLVDTIDSLMSEGVDTLNQANLTDSEELRTLQSKPNKTEADNKRIDELRTQITSSYTSIMFSTSKGLKALYDYTKGSLEDKLSDLRQKDPSATTQKQIGLLEYALRNFGDLDNLYSNKKDEGVIGYHLYKSDLIGQDVFKELSSQERDAEIEEEEESGREEQGKEYYDRGGNESSIFELADKEIKAILKSLNQTDLEGNVLTNQLGFSKLVPFKQAFAYIARTLQNSRDLQEMYDRLEAEKNIYHPIKQLLAKMGTLDTVNDKEQDLWSKFFQTFNKYRILLNQLTVNETSRKNSKGETIESVYDIRIGNAISDTKAVGQTWENEFKKEQDNPFIKYSTNGNYLDIVAIFDKWKNIDSVNANPIDFLNDIGIKVSKLPVIEKELKKEVNSGRIRLSGIYKNLEVLNQKGVNVRDLWRFLDHNKTLGLTGQTGPNSNYGKILALQAKYSGEYSDFMVTNATGDPQSEFSQNNSLTQLVKQINSVSSYNELVNNLPTSQYNNTKNIPGRPYNPFVNRSVWFKSLFDMTSTGGVKYQGNEIVIDNLSGINSSFNDEIFNEGVALSQADEIGKLLHDFHVQLMKFTPELTRHAGKKTSLTTYLRNYKTGSKNTRLYVDTEKFVTDQGQFNEGFDKFFSIVKEYISGELDRVNYSKELLNTVDQFDFNYLKRGTKFVAFAGVLSESTKESLYNYKGDWTQDKNLSNVIYDEVQEYFNKQVKNLEDKFNEVTGRNGQGGFISPTLIEKTRQDAMKLGRKDTSDSNIRLGLMSSFIANNWIHHFEEMIMFYGDIALYKDFFKRNASLNSTGDIIRNDQQFINYVNQKLGKKFAEQAGVDPSLLSYNGVYNTAIVADVLTKSVYLDKYKASVNSPVIDSKYGDNGINEADAQGLISFDTYRIVLKGLGKWSNEQERIYQAILAGEDVGNIEASEFFPTLKMGYFGPIQNDYLSLTGLHKFALFPLIPGVIPENLTELHNKMMKEGIDYLTFESGSKVGTIAKPLRKDGEILGNDYQPLYSDINTRTLNTTPFVKNRVFSEYLKYQVEAAPKFKKSITFMTQLRKLAELGLMEKGLPTDYVTTEVTWNKLSEAEKRKLSKNYSLRADYLDNLKEPVEANKDKILKEIGWKRNSQGKPVGSMESLLRLISDELKRSDVGDHEWAYIQTIKDSVKNSLDISQSAELIDKVITSLANKRLIKLKVNGEQLVMVSTTGFEDKAFAYAQPRNFDKPTEEDLTKYGTNDLPTYHLGKDGLIKAAKVKIAMQGKFKALLTLPEVTQKANQLGISNLRALNILLKDEDWLSEGSNRWFVTMVGARIPTQGPNSAEFVEVYEFLPEIAGNIIIAPSEVTSKGGSDFDFDKLPLMMPNIKNIGGKVQLQRNYSYDEAKKLHDRIVKKAVDLDALQSSYGTTRWKQDKAVDNLLKDIFGNNWDLEYTDDEINDILKEQGKDTFEEFYDKLNTTAGIENKLIQSLVNILRQPSNFPDLIRPNETDLVKPFADDLRGENKSDKEGTRMFEALHNIGVQQSNSLGKDVLGTMAKSNTINAVFNGIGMSLHPTFNQLTRSGKVSVPNKRTTLLFDHNSVNGNISLSNRFDASGENNIVDVISQLINGAVDVEKDDWISYIQGNNEIAPIMLFMVQAGVPIKQVVYFLSQPLIKEYVKERRILDSSFAKVLGRQYAFSVRLDALRNLLEDSRNGFELEDTKPKTIYAETLNKTASIDKFDGEVLKKRAKDTSKIITDFDRAVFLHFLEIEQMSNLVDKINFAFNIDTTTLQSLDEFRGKIIEIESLKDDNLIPARYIDKIIKDSPIGPFYIHDFILDVFESTMPLRNSKVLSDFMGGMGSIHKDEIESTFGEYPDGLLSFKRNFKNDLISYIFQNEVRKPVNIIEIPLEVVKEDIWYERLLKDNKTNGSKLDNESEEDFNTRMEKISYDQYLQNISLENAFDPDYLFKGKNNVAARFVYIMDKYPQLKQNFSILNNIKKSDKGEFSNLMLSTTKLTKDEIDTFYENMLDLANSNKLLVLEGVNQKDADFIAGFFKKLPMWLYLQSGPNTRSPFSFARVLPQQKIVRILEKPIKDLVTTIDDKYLNDFMVKFMTANANKAFRLRFKDLAQIEEQKPTEQSIVQNIEIEEASGVVEEIIVTEPRIVTDEELNDAMNCIPKTK